MGHGASTTHEAAASGDLWALRRVLKARQQPVDGQVDGRTALLLAVREGHSDAVLLLLSAGANPNIICQIRSNQGHEYDWSALHEAASRNMCEVLRLLVSRGGDVNLAAHHQMTPLHIAAWHGHSDAVKTLIALGCDVNALDQFQESAIVVPICHGDVSCVRTLLQSGCRLSGRSWGNLRKIRGKNEYDFRETLYGRQGPYSLLLLAIKYSWLNIARLLLQHGFNANKYQLFDILKAIKANLGCIDSDGRRLVECFVNAGYRFRHNDDRLLDDLTHEPPTMVGHGYDLELISWLRSQATAQPDRLVAICRRVIRSHMSIVHRHASILVYIQQLCIPYTLIDYLSLSEFGDDGLGAEGQSCPIGWLTGPTGEQGQREPLYLAMPNCKGPPRHPYVQFWFASCLGVHRH